MRIKKTPQPYFEHIIGPWRISAFRRELTNNRGTHKGWYRKQVEVSITHDPLDFELMNTSSYDNNARERLEADLDDCLMDRKLSYFSNQLPDNAKQIALDLFDAILETDGNDAFCYIGPQPGCF